MKVRFLTAGATRAILLGGLFLSASCRAQNQNDAAPLSTFTINELFGVSHPRQIIDFDFAKKVDAGNSFLVGPDGEEAAFQILNDGKIAVATDLPANTSKSWKLMSGRAPKVFPDGVKVNEAATYYEITNGLTGVRIARPAADLKNALAPVQGILYRDGTWTATGPNRLSPLAGGTATEVTAMTARFIERGPLKVVVEVAYQIKRPEAVYEKATIPAGPGFYKSVIEVQAGQPSIVFEEETDCDVYYGLDVYAGLQPTQARYRGHHSSSPENGHEPDGKIYRASNARPENAGLDATVDLKYDRLRSYPFDWISSVALWNPWAVDSGWYWQYFDGKAPESANLLGVYAGPASRLIGVGNSGLSFATAPPGVLQAADKNSIALGQLPMQALFPTRAQEPPVLVAPVATISIASFRRDAGANVWPRSRFAWRLFVGTKADLAPPEKVQPIARQFNLHGGVNLNKVYRYAANFPDPPQGYGALYMKRGVFESVVDRARKDNDFYRQLVQNDESLKSIVDMRMDESGQKSAATVGALSAAASAKMNAIVNGDGIFDFPHMYFHSGLSIAAAGVAIDQILADARTSPADKARTKAVAAFYASLMWDDDFAPLFPGTAVNLGTPNMPVMMNGTRDFYALLMASHPSMQARIKRIEANTLAELHHITNEHGAEYGSVHYMQASMIPTLSSLLQLKMAGKDYFKSEPRLSKFAEFYMNFLTPREERFGGRRKVVAIGDGSTETTSIFGRLATGFRDADPKLSSRLMGAWKEGGNHDGFMGSTLFQIDEGAPASDPKLSSATFPGYYSVLRSAWSTPDETALWMVNGEFYSDHRHHDHGSIILYALGAPISLDWGSMYYPWAGGGMMHSMVLPAAHINSKAGAASWDADSPALGAGGDSAAHYAWGDSTQDAFENFSNSSHVRAHFSATAKDGGTWTREATLISANAKYPVILLRDNFAGNGASASKIFTLNLMAEGDVETPSGKITPILRTYKYPEDAGVASELPSSGKIFDLPSGVNRLSFKGQWGVDFDLYTLSNQSRQALIGNWANTWAHSPTMPQFQEAMKRPFEERQDIMRIKGDGPFTTLILPHRQNEKRDVQVTQKDGMITISAGDEKTIVGENFYVFQNAARRIVTIFGNEKVEREGVQMQGGPMEIVIEAKRVVLSLHGAKGARRLKIPGDWQVAKGNKAPIPIAFKNGERVLEYSGSEPVSIVLEKR